MKLQMESGLSWWPRSVQETMLIVSSFLFLSSTPFAFWRWRQGNAEIIINERKNRMAASSFPSKCMLCPGVEAQGCWGFGRCDRHLPLRGSCICEIFVVTLNTCRPRETSGDSEIIFSHGILDFGHVPWSNTNSDTFMNNLSFISDANRSIIWVFISWWI